MSEERINLDWVSPGPVSTRFMMTPPIMGGLQLLGGPIGGGKTTTKQTKAIRLAAQQQPSTRTRARNDRGELVPVRKVKICSVRDTYRQLWKTTLPTWWMRVPKTIGEWGGAENGPCSHHVTFQLRDNTLVDLIHDFIAIGENAVEDVMRGYQPTFWLLNEMDLLAWAVWEYGAGRAGRYPEMSEGGPTWYGALADCNAPEFESEVYQNIYTKSPAELEAMGIQLFLQPSGLSPQAENTKNLVAGYYVNAARGKSRDYVARMIENRPGVSVAGKPVHPEFNDAIHVPTHEIEPIAGLPVIIGIDPRTYPSAVFLQRLPGGQRRFVDELQGEQNMGARRFGKLLAELLHDRFPFLRPSDPMRLAWQHNDTPQVVRLAGVVGMVDPSAQYGADKEAGEQDWLEIVESVSGIKIIPAPSNNLAVRREALKKPLSELIDGQPAIIVSPRCAKLRTGLNSGFRFRKLNTPGVAKYGTEVEKNSYADICEAAEYACLSDGAELEIRDRKQADTATLQQMAQGHQHDWDPFNT